jgi:hypothetical protein
MNRSELRTVTAAIAVGAGAEATIGSAIPENMRRFIYRIKFTNDIVAVNQLILGKRENGAGATTNIDTIQTVVAQEVVTDPDDLKEDSAPLYIIDGPPGNAGTTVGLAANSLVRAYATAGVGILTLWYIDAPA